MAKKKDTRYEVSRGGRAIPYTTPTGIHTCLYNIATAAEAIGRTAQTLRKWEVSGTVPLTPFKVGGKRVYSDEHIDALVECAERYHIRAGVKIQDTCFSSSLYKKYQEIYDKFFTVKENENGK